MFKILSITENFMIGRIKKLKLDRDTRKKIEFVMAVMRTASNLITVFTSLVALVLTYLTFVRVYHNG